MTTSTSQGAGSQTGSGYTVSGSGTVAGYSVSGSGSGSGSESGAGEAELADGSWLAGLAMGDSPRILSPSTLKSAVIALATLSISLSVIYL